MLSPETVEIDRVTKDRNRLRRELDEARAEQNALRGALEDALVIMHTCRNTSASEHNTRVRAWDAKHSDALGIVEQSQRQGGTES